MWGCQCYKLRKKEDQINIHSLNDPCVMILILGQLSHILMKCLIKNEIKIITTLTFFLLKPQQKTNVGLLAEEH